MTSLMMLLFLTSNHQSLFKPHNHLFKGIDRKIKMSKNNYDYLFKFIMIGDSSVGKSCLLMRLLQGRFKSQHEPTLGVEFGSKLCTINNKSIKLQIWDTAGQQSFKSITRAYYKGSIAAILIFDISHQRSFTNLNNWLYELKNHSHQKINIILVGNKKDLSSEREVSQEMAINFVTKHGLLAYIETSAMNGENVEKPFMDLAQEVMNKIDNGVINIQQDTAYGVKPGNKMRVNYLNPNIQLKKEQSKEFLEEKNNCAC